MAHVDINGGRLEVIERGRGDPVVLVHGSASDHRTWQAQIEPLAERYRVIAYSRRYHWPNAEISDGRDYSMTQHVDDLETVLGGLHASPAHLVGHSYGGFLCLLLAVRAPHLVRTLVLTEPPVITLFVSDPPKPLELVRLLVTRPRTAAAVVRFGAKGVAPALRAFRRGDPDAGVRTYGNAVLGGGGYDRLSEERKAQVADNLPNVRAELLGSGFAPVAAVEVRTVRRPALLVTGQESIALFRIMVDRLEELLPSTGRVEIPGASHLVHEENPPAFNAALLRFLDRHRSAA